ncbi:MAG: MMPL family transporter [Acidimicrobiales bacterium]
MTFRAPVHDNRTPPSALYRLGALSGRHPWRVIALWLLAAVVLGTWTRTDRPTYADATTLGGTQASIGAALLGAHEPATREATGLVVVATDHGTLAAYQPALEASVANLARLPHVVAVSDPLTATPPTVSPSGRVAYATVRLDVAAPALGSGLAAGLLRATAPATRAGLAVDFGGAFDQITRPRTTDRRAEVLGVAVALVVLALTFGSVLGAIVPLVSAVIGVVIGLSILGLVALVLTFATASPTLAAMIGLGVGIDYAVFLTTRFRQLLVEGHDPGEAAGRATASSGRAVVIAASTVAVAMLGLYGSGLSFIGLLGLAAVFAIVVAALASVTLVPAALVLAGRRLDRYRVRRTVAEATRADDGWHRYAALVGRHPWRALVLGAATLAVVALPILSLQLGHVSTGADPTSFTDRRAYDLLARGFGPGINGPLTVVVDTGGHAAPAGRAALVARALAATPDVAAVTALRPSPDGHLLVATVLPASDPSAAASTTLFSTLVDTTLPHALAGTAWRGYVTGPTALQDEFDTIVASRTPLIVLLVIAVAFVLIASAFRSLVLALEAAALNLLSIGAAYGVLVAVFQWGWGRAWLGLPASVPIEAYVPMIMFAIVFGLSMDYEVFLLSRIHESWLRGGDNAAAVTEGLARTGRVIGAAALIMVSVFLSFVTSPLVVVEQLAIGLSAAVLLDATIVRLVLVPAAMFLLGEQNWRLPRWLDRVLPRVRLDG